MDYMNYGDYLTINYLPSKVVVRIFEFLPLEDRKNIRLTCRFWHECCTRTSITKREKFVFRTESSLQNLDILFKPHFSQMNLEFQSLLLDNLPTNFWEVCGQQVHSLQIFNCKWNDLTIQNIILYCVNLASFKMTLRSTEPMVLKEGRYILCSPSLLNKLVKEGVEQTKLHTFTLSFIDNVSVQLPESVFKDIFRIYTAIKHFNVGTFSDKNQWCINFSPLIQLKAEQLPFLRSDKYRLNWSTQLESLTFNLYTDGNWIRSCNSKPSHRLRALKKFETILLYNPSTLRTLIDFFILQKNLTVVKLTLLTDGRLENMKKVVFLVLESCPKLLEFYFRSDRFPFCIEWDEIPRFITSISKLHCLRVEFLIPEPNDTSSYEILKSSSYPKNFALNTLQLSFLEMDYVFCVSFLERCSSLKHLEVLYVTDSMLQIILKYLVNLETLVIPDVSECTDYGFLGHEEGGYSINRLQQLRTFDLYFPETECDCSITEKLVLELQLPRLKYLVLSIRLFKKLSEEILISLALKIPELTSLALDEVFGDEGSTKRAVKFCQHLKKLRRLICVEYLSADFDYAECHEVRQFFEACPSLRYISLDNGTWFFNPFTREVSFILTEYCEFQDPIFGPIFDPI